VKGFGGPDRCNREYPKVNQEGKHLSIGQIEVLIGSAPGGIEDDGQADLQQANNHLDNCEACQRLVSMYREGDRILRQLGERVTKEATRDCPSEISLFELAAGVMGLEEADKLLQHTVQCDRCGPFLCQAAEILNPVQKREEDALLSSLPSGRPEWQASLARALASASAPHPAPPASASTTRRDIRIRFTARLHWVYAAAAGLVLATLAGSWLVIRLQSPSADTLIAQAYSEQRTIELRLAETAYAPIRQQRGAEGSSFSKPAALLEAELLIQRQLQKTPNDPKWLAAGGRSALLEWHYEDAIRSFNQVLETNPDSSDVLRDLATAYFQRAEIEHRPIDYGNAMQELSKALAKRPDDAVARFNRAVIDERMFLYDDAEKDWEAYLRLDPTGPWAPEAQQRLDEVRSKLQKHDQSQKVLIEEPVAAAMFFGERLRNDAPTHGDGDSIDEQYLDLASEKWLSALAKDLRRGKSIQESSYGRALQTFAQLWKTRHGDPWVSDLLKSANAPGFADAAEALSSAVAAASQGDPSLARQKADRAARLFGRMPNQAGALRARLEGVYALQRSLEVGKCVHSARNLGAQLEGLPYYWIQAKTLLEASACYASSARLEDAEQSVLLAERIETQRGFEVLYIRGLSFLSDFAADKGDRGLAWKHAQAGLERFWNGRFPAIRGYALCASLGYLAEDSDQGWVAMAFWSQAVQLVGETANRSTEGLARYQLAAEEIAVGKRAEADQELRKATRIFSSLPNSTATLNYRVASEVSLAAVELSSRDRSSARALLNAIAPSVLNVGQYQTVFQYYQTLAEVQVLDGDWRTAERSLYSAVAVSQRGLSSLGRDRDRINWDQQTSEAYRSLVRTLLAQPGREEEALRVWEWHRSLPFRTLSANHLFPESTLAELATKPPRPGEADLRSLVPTLTNVTFLTYAELKDGIALWAYDNRGITFRRIPVPIAEVTAVGKSFVRLCSDPTSDAAVLRLNAKKLYEWLISPIQSFLSPERTIWIEPDGDLSFLPFQALVDPDGVPLLMNFSIAYRSSATSKQRAEEPRVSASDYAFVVSSSLFPTPSSRPLPPLPDAVREAEMIAARFPNHRLLVGEGTRVDEIQAELRRCAVFHYAGHYLPTGMQGRTVLGSILNSESARNSRQGVTSSFPLHRSKLVVLSACSTGSGEKLGLFDPDGLVRPLLWAGASRVIASRWNVDSRVTAKLMDKLYSDLLSGKTSVDALRAASTQLAADSEYRHPYYWAGFGVFAQD
jgi:CHAT domain-containing protein/tetratricopeptide (TPR) repeat protein